MSSSPLDNVGGLKEALPDAGSVPVVSRYPQPWNSMVVYEGDDVSDEERPSKSYWRDIGHIPGAWKIRGKNYLKDKKKVPSLRSAMCVAAMEWSFHPKKPIEHISAEPDGYLASLRAQGRERGKKYPWMLVINFMVPSVGNFATYFVRRENHPDPVFDRILQSFMDAESDDYRNKRFKMIPTVKEGPWMVRKTIGTRPVLPSKALKTQYFKDENSYEISVNVGSSHIGSFMMGFVKKFASGVALKMGFLIESQCEEDLPERLIGGIEVYYPRMKPGNSLGSSSSSGSF